MQTRKQGSKSRRAALKQEDLFNSILEATTDKIAMEDADFRYVAYNSAYREEFKRIFGVDLQIGMSMIDALAHLPEDRDHAVEIWKRALAGETFVVEQAFGDPGRERNYYELHFFPIRDSDGRITGAVHIGHDVTRRHMAEEEVKRERQRLTSVLEMLPAYVVLLTSDYHVPFANRYFRERFGDANGRRCYEYLFDRRDPCEICESYKPLKTGKPHRWEWLGPDSRNYDIHDFLIADSDGSPMIMEMGIDITERKTAEQALKVANEALEQRVAERTAELELSEADLNRAQVVAQTGSWRLNTRLNQLVWSAETYRIFGITPETPMTYESFLSAIHPDDRAYVDMQWTAAMQGKQPYDIEHRIIVDGSIKWVREKAELEFDAKGALLGGFGAVQDITARKAAEERIKASLDEKEVLLREIHHRVKNNMQVVSSLVSLQANATSDPAQREALAELRDRVRSMAMVHDRLYQADNFSRINFSQYVRKLMESLWHAHVPATRRGARMELDLQPTSLPMDAAVPCALILNELVLNVLKHAFADRPDCRLNVSLSCVEGVTRLSVQDNGPGLPPGLDWRNATSLGLRLVQLLSTQIHATVEAQAVETGAGGTEFTITFAADSREA